MIAMKKVAFALEATIKLLMVPIMINNNATILEVLQVCAYLLATYIPYIEVVDRKRVIYDH